MWCFYLCNQDMSQNFLSKYFADEHPFTIYIGFVRLPGFWHIPSENWKHSWCLCHSMSILGTWILASLLESMELSTRKPAKNLHFFAGYLAEKGHDWLMVDVGSINSWDIHGWSMIIPSMTGKKKIPFGKHTKNIKKLWKVTMFHGKIHCFDWVIFSSYVNVYQRVSVVIQQWFPSLFRSQHPRRRFVVFSIESNPIKS